ncbi:hypothetical protein KS4_22730 [Poriferisphaera corsica]|uniref:Flippase-like domain-containing protein n=1 Tax=Poriferisphaera corsica TaxID=2528020 RepID=A0A517YVE1_9BACT|nr:lysylphosphatidylglycerol synthase domain-containing protein [Poriferisphaera corsica]QDU34208.1 hypothetical protein KS4_22730 [Poriferisphaera corsica]
MQQQLAKYLKPFAPFLGLALLLLAIYYAFQNLSFVTLQSIHPLYLFAIIALVFLNLLLTSSLFHIITKSFPTTSPVRFRLMFKLITASSLLNYIPLLRPGLWGRAAYLKSSHNLALKDSLLILAIILGLSLYIFIPAASILLLGVIYQFPSFAINLILLFAFILLTLIPRFTKPLIQKLLLNRTHAIVTPTLWPLLKIIDMLIAALRLYLAFLALGSPISYHSALLATAASLLIKLLGLTPNGLGLSEWTVAGLIALTTPITAPLAAAAALIDRAADILLTLPLGLITAYQLKHKSTSK